MNNSEDFFLKKLTNIQPETRDASRALFVAIVCYVGGDGDVATH
jgi:hypothetical protein